jgi:hypothetical protein
VRRIAFWTLLLSCLPPLSPDGQVARQCLPQGKPVTIRGTLAHVDENGYRHWIALRPMRPICTLADPADQFSGPADHVTAIQTFNADSEDVRSRLEQLAGRRAELTGTLTQWHTGYQRAEVVLNVGTVRPIDPEGEAALASPRPPKPHVRDVAAYDITVRAGRSLIKQAREVGSNKSLIPVDEYAPHWVTGGDVVYVHCRDDYDAQFINGSMTEDAALCGLSGNSCGFGIPEHGTITLTMRCTKVQ